MSELNKKRFEILLSYIHAHAKGRYCLFDNEGHSVEAVYDTDYESSNGMDDESGNYEEFQCIVFQRVSNGSLFEIDYRRIPIKVTCDGETVYE